MHILLTNDDGPPSNQSSPYIHSLVDTLQKAGHLVSVVLPNTQRSWIGKAHMVGQTLTPSYFRPGTLHQDDGITQDRPFNDGKEEWILLDGTPASCAQIGFWHLFGDRGPIDVIVSGPNYGRNTTAVFALSSGTLGAALEGATMGQKSIAVSYAFESRDHDPESIAAASRVATKLIEKFAKEWPEDVHVFSINVPLRRDIESRLITYTDMLQNKWSSGSCFTVLKDDAEDKDPNLEEQKIRDRRQSADGEKGEKPANRNHVTFKWSPNFGDVRSAAKEAGRGDGWHVMQGHVTVTPLRANYWHLPQFTGEIKLSGHTSASLLQPSSRPLAVVHHPEPYVQPLIISALKALEIVDFEISETSVGDLSRHCVYFQDYENLDFEKLMNHSRTQLVCAYAIRKALIRKHYLSNTIDAWLVKHPESILRQHFKSSIHFELDYAEFLDDALVDAWDLHESMSRNENADDRDSREWWILKPGMSDGGNGIRLFSSIEQLQAIFEAWDPPSDDEDGEEIDDEQFEEAGHQQSLMTSQLRHFIVQPYIDDPLLLTSHNNRKFHVRVYVVAVGALKVFVFREMLALFSAKAYRSPNAYEEDDVVDLSEQLTNTCFQDETTKDSSVLRFWNLENEGLTIVEKEKIFGQICDVTGEVFEAAAREQMVHFQAVPNAFEVFGVDFLIDAHCNAWLLELNAYPDFKQTGKDLQEQVVGKLFENIVSVAVAPFFGAKHNELGNDQMRLVREIDLGRR